MTDSRKKLVEYTLSIGGQMIESNVGKAPLEYAPGDATIFAALARVLDGMSEGEETTVTFDPRDTYGPDIKSAYRTFPRRSLPQSDSLQKGTVIEMKTKEGKVICGVVWRLTEDEILINFNHPLAGKTLTFRLRILKVL